MAILIIKTSDHVNPDPDQDRLYAYKAGMVIAVVEDDHVFGIEESKQAWIASGRSAADWHGRTALLQLPGVPVSDVGNLIVPETTHDVGIPTQNAEPYRRRKFAFTPVGRSQSRRNGLAVNGALQSTKALLRAQLIRVTNGKSAPEALP